MSPRPQLLTRMEADFKPCPAWCQSGRPRAPLTCGDLPALPQLGGHLLGQHGLQQGLRLLFRGQVRREDPQLLLLPLQLAGQLHLRQALLVEQDEVPGGVVGGDVGASGDPPAPAGCGAWGSTGTSCPAGAPSRSSGLPAREREGTRRRVTGRPDRRPHGPPCPPAQACSSRPPKVPKVPSFPSVSTSPLLLCPRAPRLLFLPRRDSRP